MSSKGVKTGFAVLLSLACLATLLCVPSSRSPGNIQVQDSSPALVHADVALLEQAAPPLSTEIAGAPDPHEGMSVAMTPEQAQELSPFVELGSLDSAPEESFDDFILRVGMEIDLFTRTTLHEACAVIMKATDRDAWRVRITTNRSHISCTMIVFEEEGFERTGEDIHSHPRIVGGVKANARDIAKRKDFFCGEGIIVFDENFSGIDYAHGPGYLVSRGRLLYQHGAQYPVRQLARFEPLAQSSLMPPAGEVGQETSLVAAAWKNEDVAGLPSTACEDPQTQIEAHFVQNAAVDAPIELPLD